MYHPDDTIGPYRLVKRLGQGTVGAVWLAHDNSSIVHEQFALKLPDSEDIDSEKMRQDAVIWLRAGGHPNVLPVIDARFYNDQIAIVTQYVAGGTLAQRLEQNGGKAPSPEWAAAVTVGVLKGLEHLHSLGMVHRDLKPSNILMDGDIPKITDFGLARIHRSSVRSRQSESAAAFQYTPPEMFRGWFSEQSDVWSMGVILYQMLSGSLPFPNGTHAEIIQAICNTAAPPLLPPIPERLRMVVQRALSADLSGRYPTARAMRDDIAPHPASDLAQKSMLAVPTLDSSLHIAKAAPTPPAPIQAQPASTAARPPAAQPTAFPPAPVPDPPSRPAIAPAAAPGWSPGNAAPAVTKPGGTKPQTAPIQQPRRPALLPVAAVAVLLAGGAGAFVLYRKSATPAADPSMSRSPVTAPQMPVSSGLPTSAGDVPVPATESGNSVDSGEGAPLTSGSIPGSSAGTDSASGIPANSSGETHSPTTVKTPDVLPGVAKPAGKTALPPVPKSSGSNPKASPKPHAPAPDHHNPKPSPHPPAKTKHRTPVPHRIVPVVHTPVRRAHVPVVHHTPAPATHQHHAPPHERHPAAPTTTGDIDK